MVTFLKDQNEIYYQAKYKTFHHKMHRKDLLREQIYITKKIKATKEKKQLNYNN